MIAMSKEISGLFSGTIGSEGWRSTSFSTSRTFASKDPLVGELATDIDSKISWTESTKPWYVFKGKTDGITYGGTRLNSSPLKKQDLSIGVFFSPENKGLKNKFNDYINDEWMKWSGNIYYAIRKTERGKGYGTAMLSEAIKVTKSFGMKQIFLQSSAGNIASQRVIEKNGGKLRHEDNGTHYYVISND